MSTKTSFKRIAAVAAVALTLGGFSAVSAHATTSDASDNVSVTKIAAGTAPVVQAGQTVQVPVTVTGTFAVNTASVLKLSVIPVTVPSGSARTQADFTINTVDATSHALASTGTAEAKTVINKWYTTGNGALGGAAIDKVTNATTTSIVTFAGTHVVGTSVKLYVSFVADKAGTYTFTVINDTTANGALDSGEVSSSLITVNTATPVASVVITPLNTGTAQASTAGVVAKIQALDAAGAMTTLGNADVITLSSSSTSMTINGAATANLVASDFGAGTPSSGYATVTLASSTAASYILTATFGGALPAYSTTKSITFTATTSSGATGTALDSTSAYVLGGTAAAITAGSFVDATATAHQKISSAPALTGATGTALYVMPAGSFTWTLTDTASADAAIKIAVEVTEIGGTISGIPGGSVVYTIPVTLTAGVGTFTVTTVSTANSGTAAFQGYTIKVLSSGAPVFAGASIVAQNGAGTLTNGASTLGSVNGGAISNTVTVKDGYGNTVSGATVVDTITGRNTRTLVATTDANGVATFTYVDAGTTSTATSDTNSLSATYFVGTAVANPTGSFTVNYSANNAAATITMTTDNQVAGVANATVTPEPIYTVDGAENGARSITVTVKNAAGIVIAGLPVTFSVAGTGAAILSTTATAVTSPTGVATAKVYGWVSGTYTITATAGGVSATGTETFYSTGVASARTVSATVSGNIVTANVKDRFGNNVSNVPVYASISGGGNIGGLLVTAAQNTNAAGNATWVVTGSGTVTVSAVDPNAIAGTTAGQTCAAAGKADCLTTPTAFTASTAGTVGTAETGVGASYAPAGVSSASVTVTAFVDTSTVTAANNAAAVAASAGQAATDAANAAQDAANEATDAANAATDAANNAMDSADAANAAAQDAGDKADAALAAITDLATKISDIASQVSALSSVVAKIAAAVAKISKKVKA